MFGKRMKLFKLLGFEVKNRCELAGHRGAGHLVPGQRGLSLTGIRT